MLPMMLLLLLLLLFQNEFGNLYEPFTFGALALSCVRLIHGHGGFRS